MNIVLLFNQLKVFEPTCVFNQTPACARISFDCGYAALCKVCYYFFGEARQKGTSHRIYKTSWKGDPRVNIQNSKGKAKAYQVKHVLKAMVLSKVL